MKNYQIYTSQCAPSQTADTLAAVGEKVGFLPNVFAVMGATPAALNGFVALNQCFGETSLSPTEREIVQIAVSVENRGGYCVAGHSSFAKKQDIRDDIIQTLRIRGTLDDPKLAALHTFSRLLAIKKGNLEESEIEQFLAAGYTQAQILEVILGTVVKMFSNIADNVLGFPLDDPFVPYAWEPESAERSTAGEREAA